MTTPEHVDSTTYAPFVLLDTGEHRSLILSDNHLIAKRHIFEERGDEGFCGNGYDWASVACVVVAESLPDLEGEISFDPEASMFSATGSRPALEKLGKAMQALFHDDAALRDVLSRAEID